MTSRVDRQLADVNPVPAPAPGRVSPAQERLLSQLVATPRPRRRGGALPRLVPIAAAAVVVVAIVLVVVRGAAVDDEVEATATPGVSADAELIHVVTRLYGSVYGPGYGERLDGWLQPSTGRLRIVITTGDEMTLQQVVGANDRFRSWQGALGNANGFTEDRIAPRLAENLRGQVSDRMAGLIEGAKQGFRQDGTTFGAPTVEPGEYRGRAVMIHRIAPTLVSDGSPSGFYFKWYTDRETGAIVAFERGPAGKDGKDGVEQGEELVTFEGFGRDDAPLRELDWREPPEIRSPQMPPPVTTRRDDPIDPRDAPTPTPTPTPATP
jgi:hypothetical protein